MFLLKVSYGHKYDKNLIDMIYNTNDEFFKEYIN